MLSFIKKVTQLFMLLVVMSVFGVGKVKAQSITPAQDGTGTNVTTDGNIHNINGGSLSGDGANLFHSFEQFGLSQGEVANFLANPNLVNILGRIGGGNPSIINGLIQVTGGNANLFLMNPAGFVFGNSAGLDVPGSFTATTANGIGFGGGWFSAAGGNDYQALVGNPIGFGFGMAQPGGIVNQGKLAVGEGQNLSLVGGAVVNTGELKAPGGGVVVSAVAGENLVRLSIPGNVLSLEVEPLGGSQPNGWNLPITALPDLLTVGASGVRGNPDGTVEVAGVRVPGDAGTAIVSGKVDVSGETGGNVGVFGDKVAVVGAEIDASGVNGGGRVLVGGDYQGKGSVPNAQRTLVDGDARINADAGVNGDGGRVIVWGDEATRFDGSISARGGSVSGDGGFVEVSGKENLQFTGTVDTSAPFGEVGNLLLDPKNIKIEACGCVLATDQFFGNNPTGVSDIRGTNLAAAINKTNVILQANNDITIDDNVTSTTAGNGLTLQAGRSITFNANRTINLAGGEFNARINDENAISANRDAGTAQFFMNPGSQILTNGGDVTIDHGTFGGVSVGEVRLEGGQINSGTGDIEMTGTGRDGGSLNRGIVLDTGSIVESSGAGTITLNGAGGTGTEENFGILIDEASVVESTGSGIITLNGTGGTGARFNFGIGIFNGGGVRSIDGNIILNGTGNGTENGNQGIGLIRGGVVESLGQGNITLNGISGSGTILNHGILLNVNSNISSGEGNISLTGISNGTVDNNDGIQLTNGSIVSSGSGNITLTGDEINFFDTSQIRGTGNLLLQPLSPNLGITIAGNTNDNQLNLSTSELNALGNGFAGISIGRTDGTGTITIDPTGVNFNDPLNLRSPNSGGAIVVNGQIQSNGNALTLNAGNTVDINADIITTGGAININSSGIIDSTGSALLSFSETGNGGDVTLNANGNITTGNNPNFDFGGIPIISASIVSGGELNGGKIEIVSNSGTINTTAGILSSGSLNPAGSGGNGPTNLASRNSGNIILKANGNITTGPIASGGNFSGGDIEITSSRGEIDTTTPGIPPVVAILSSTLAGPGGIASQHSGNITLKAAGEMTVSFIQTLGSQTAGDIILITTEDGNINAKSLDARLFNPSNTSGNGGAITLEAAGNLHIGSIDASSTSNTGGQIQLNGINITSGNIATTGNNVIINNPLTLTNDTSIYIGGTGGNVNFGSTVNGNQNLTLNAGSGNITFNDQVGNTQPLGNIQANSTGTTRINSPVQATSITTDTGGETQINGNITTTGTNGQNYNDNVRIDDNATLNSNNNPININGTVNSQTGETNNLNINSGSSTTTLNGDAGNTTPLGDINVNSTNNITTPNLTANNINLTSGNNINTGNISTNSTTGNSGNVNLTATGDINTNNINTNSTTGNSGSVNITATGNTNTANINTNSTTGNGGEIAIQGTNVTTGNLDSSGNNGGNTSIQATTSIKAGTINSSGTSGNGGNVTLDPDNDIEVNSINAQGGANGVGGNVDITTAQNFRATDTFTDQNGTNASISTAGGQGGGSVTIRHGGGSQNTPFVVGDATTNGTAGAITTGSNNTIAPVQSFPGSYSQGTPPNQIGIITQDSPSNEFDKPEDLEKIPDLPSQKEPQQSVETVVSKIEEHFTTQADEYLGGKTRIKTLDEIRNELRGIVAATDGKVKPGIIYTFFLPRGPVVRPEIDGDKTPPQSDIALEVPLELMLVTSEGEVITKSNFEVTRTQVLAEANKFLASVSSRSKEGTTEYQKPAKQFYNWLIKPIEKDLEAQGVNNLVFVMDEGLRSLPLAAMQDPHDNKFIIQKGYSIGLTPSISLINIREADIRNALKNTRVLAMGASKFTELKPLPGVETEISLILKQWSGDSFLNDKFTIENLRAAHNNGSYQILHLATHAKFVPSPLNNSYIQFGEGEKVNLDDILNLGLDEPLVELLVLSACETAWGNKDAELGFAGIARLSGAKSVLASLWEINDVTNLGLMTEFYTKLKTAPTKAEALRQAQVAMLEGKVKFENGDLVGDGYREALPKELKIENKVLSHPHYWSGFTMIGNPW